MNKIKISDIIPLEGDNMNYYTRKKTISTLMSIVLLLNSVNGKLKNEHYILPSECHIPSPEYVLMKSKNKRRLK